MNKLVYVGFAFQHHKGTHAGYHQIKDYLNYDYVIDCQQYIENCKIRHHNIFNKVRRIIIKSIFGDLPEIPWFLFKCAWLAISKGNMTFHFIYGENIYINFPFLHVRGSKVVTTFHQPYDWFAGRQKWNKRIKRLNHIILVGKTEVTKFELLSGRKNVTFIPHGINNEFYKPDLNVQHHRMLLTVGNWLRDYQFANKVYREIRQRCPNVEIVIVSLPTNKQYIDDDLNVKYLSGISDDELLSLYRKTSCLFLPLIRYTANNALLEAGSVGCNILIASDKPDNSYIPENYIHLQHMSVNEVVNEIISMVHNDTRNLKLSEFVVLNYGWRKIGNVTKELLHQSDK